MKNLNLQNIEENKVRENLFTEKKNKSQKFQKEKLNDLVFETKRIMESVSLNKNSKSSKRLLLEENLRVNTNPISKYNTNNYLKIGNQSNSSFSTAHNSICPTPISSPELETKTNLNESPKNLVFDTKKISNINLFECFFDNNIDNNISCKNNNSYQICHINSFCTKSEKYTNNNNSKKSNYQQQNYYPTHTNKILNNTKINSINNYPNLPCDNIQSYYSYSLNNLYDTNNNIDFMDSSAINTRNFFKIPIYQHQIYFENSNINNNVSNFKKKPRCSTDPLNILREQNNHMIKNVNGKSAPFEEPHNRINLENVNI